MGCLMVYGRGDVFSSANHFNQQQELAAPLIDRVELAQSGVIVSIGPSGVLPAWVRMQAAE